MCKNDTTTVSKVYETTSSPELVKAKIYKEYSLAEVQRHNTNDE